MTGRDSSVVVSPRAVVGSVTGRDSSVVVSPRAVVGSVTGRDSSVVVCGVAHRRPSGAVVRGRT